LSLVQVPNGIAGVTLGQVGVTTPDLSFQNVADIDMESSEQNRNAGSSEDGFNNQLLLADTTAILSIGSLDQQPTMDKFRLNGDETFASDGHAVKAEPNTILSEREPSTLGTSVVDPNISFQANVHPDGTAINDSTISVPHFNIGFDFSTPGSDGATADLEFLDRQEIAFESFQFLPDFSGQRNGVVGPSSFFDATSRLGQDEDQQNQTSLQHESSVNSSSATLSRHRWLVKKCGRIFRIGVNIIEEWQGGFSCGIVTALRPGMGQGV
jgi:hypothetical protein